MRYDVILDDEVSTDEYCIFCEAANEPKSELKVVKRHKSAICVFDGFPVTRFHMLVCPVRHAETYFDLTSRERIDIDDLICDICFKMKQRDKTITGFNIGWNTGESAGQTVMHAHCHVIPRRDGDIEDPTGGVRGVIPEKRIYR